MNTMWLNNEVSQVTTVTPRKAGAQLGLFLGCLKSHHPKLKQQIWFIQGGVLNQPDNQIEFLLHFHFILLKKNHRGGRRFRGLELGVSWTSACSETEFEVMKHSEHYDYEEVLTDFQILGFNFQILFFTFQITLQAFSPVNMFYWVQNGKNESNVNVHGSTMRRCERWGSLNIKVWTVTWTVRVRLCLCGSRHSSPKLSRTWKRGGGRPWSP